MPMARIAADPAPAAKTRGSRAGEKKNCISPRAARAPTGSARPLKKEQKKAERRERIALEAAKQCGRGIIPTVGAPLRFRQMLEAAADVELKLFCYEGDGTVPLRTLLRERFPDGRMPESVALVIGAEGGFSLAEVDAAKNAGFLPVGLGRRILRCETASGFALACLAYEFEL